MEATEMRRSTLQRKDRGELNQIATALGAKPSSRARKDEIIQLIINLTADGARMTPATSAPAGSRNGLAVDEDDAAASDRHRSARDGERRSGNGYRLGSQQRDDSAGHAERLSPPDARDDQRPADRGDGEEVEPGNRRRRRRSRDRDRDRDDGWDGEALAVSGRLDVRDEGYGFLRVQGCLPSRNDAYVAVKTIRQYGLRRGDHLTGSSRPANRAEKNPALLTLETVNGVAAEALDRPRFEMLTPTHAARRLTLERPGDPAAVAERLIDLLAPVGVGQRVLVKGPRHVGATGLLRRLAEAIEANEPDMHVIGLFLDQRPEDITEAQRCVRNGEVAATSFDQAPDEHVQTAEMTVERAKRVVESGRDVVLVLDGLTSLAHAYNAAGSNASKAYSGAVDGAAVHMPKKLFGAGRNTSEGASLTVIASLLTEGAAPLVATLCDEFSGTANTEIVLDRWAAELGLSPALDVIASRSRDSRSFLDADDVEALDRFRRGLIDAVGDGPAATVKALQEALSRLAGASDDSDFPA